MAHSSHSEDTGQPVDQIGSLQQALLDLKQERDRLVDLTLSRRSPQPLDRTSGDETAIMQLSQISLGGSNCLLLKVPPGCWQYYRLNGVLSKADPDDSDVSSSQEVYFGCLEHSDLEAFEEAYRDALALHKRQEGAEETPSWINIIVDRLRTEGLLMQTLKDEDALRRSRALTYAQQTLREHIDLLNKYNEIKDVATGLIGMIAEARQERIVDVMRTFNLEVND